MKIVVLLHFEQRHSVEWHSAEQCPKYDRLWVHLSSEHTESIIPGAITIQGVINKDPTVWLHGAGQPLTVLVKELSKIMTSEKLEFEERGMYSKFDDRTVI
jgi:hypothetical protein